LQKNYNLNRRREQLPIKVVAFLIGGGWAMSEYITCSRCGVVKRGHRCPHKPYRKKDKDTQADKFRKTKAWTNKSIEIRQRDRYLCRVCMANLYNTIRQFNYNKLEVHHITPLAEDYNKRLDNDNLITLCVYHHKMADNGQIPREELQNLISPPTI
jgi:5-methylcytosine-specific restriction endonuclease McrA